MSRIVINAYAKINLSLDVLNKREDGFHAVEMVMHQVALHDDVLIRCRRNNKQGIRVFLSTNKIYIPSDIRNVAYKAAVLMGTQYGERVCKGNMDIRIDIKKRIFVTAGLAGGSSNAAAVILGLNRLWGLGLNVAEMCALGAQLGSDVPFCIMGQARANRCLGRRINHDPLAATCAFAEGTGTTLIPVQGMPAFILLSKPPMSISTKQAYEQIDGLLAQAQGNLKRPNSGQLIAALKTGNRRLVYNNMINLLELYAETNYAQVKRTKKLMEEQLGAEKTLMSGSGPTIFSIYTDEQAASRAYWNLFKVNKETFLTRTIL